MSGHDPDGPSEGPADVPEHGSDREIDEAVDGSFPASDPPPFWSGGPDDEDRAPDDESA